jgi:hypothetical protein
LISCQPGAGPGREPLVACPQAIEDHAEPASTKLLGAWCVGDLDRGDDIEDNETLCTSTPARRVPLILSKSDVSSWRLELVGDLGGLTESEEHESVQGATLLD